MYGNWADNRADEDADVDFAEVHAALEACRDAGLRMAVLSNSSFSSPVITHELSKHGLDGYFDFVMVTADYAVRKPNSLVVDAAVARHVSRPASAAGTAGYRDRYRRGACGNRVRADPLQPPMARSRRAEGHRSGLSRQVRQA